MQNPARPPVERMNGARPLLSPTGQGWENGCTANSTCIFLERSPQNDRLLAGLVGEEALARLPGGALVVVYRGIPASDSGFTIPFSYAGLAVFTPEFQLVRRLPQPVLSPGEGAGSFDYFGIEDPRITRIGDTYFMHYCGPRRDPEREYRTRLCLATSTDLLNWRKHGPIPGIPDLYDNKDGALFPELVNGRYYLLHRPWGPEFPSYDFSIWLADSDSPYGPWHDCGVVTRPFQKPGWSKSWIGAGAPPLALGNGRFLEIYHTGSWTTERDRYYTVGAALFDFNSYHPQDPASIVTGRIESLMAPETPFELNLLPDGRRLDVLFPGGVYELGGWIYIIHGAADLYACVARMNKEALLSALQKAGTGSPYESQEKT